MTEEETMDAGALREALVRVDEFIAVGQRGWSSPGLLEALTIVRAAAAREPVAPAEAFRPSERFSVFASDVVEDVANWRREHPDLPWAPRSDDLVAPAEADYEVAALRRALDECRQHHADTLAGLDPHTGPALAQPPAPASAEAALSALFAPYFEAHDNADDDEDNEWCMKHLPRIAQVRAAIRGTTPLDAALGEGFTAELLSVESALATAQTRLHNVTDTLAAALRGQPSEPA